MRARAGGPWRESLRNLGSPRGHARCPEPRPGPHIDPAEWPVTDVIQIGEDWVSGVYLARLMLTTGEHAGSGALVPFVVRPPLGIRRMLVQQPVTTAQAYNNWGGKSLYTSNSTDGVAAVKVSFDRPYPAWSAANLNARWPFVWDYQLIRFLEREGIDVAYTTDVDTHREPWSLVGHRLLMTSGHDEYWTREMRDAFERARRRCQPRLHGRQHRLLADALRGRRAHDGRVPLASGRPRARPGAEDRAVPQPRSRAAGVPAVGRPVPGGFDAFRQPAPPLRTGPASLVHPWMRDTGFEYPATLRGLVGYEWDAIQEGLEPPGATVFFRYENEISNADALSDRAPSGALVFAAGSLQFSWGLDDWGPAACRRAPAALHAQRAGRPRRLTAGRWGPTRPGAVLRGGFRKCPQIRHDDRRFTV